MALVEKALLSHPDQPRIVQVLGDVQFRRGRFREAILSYERAIRLAPKYVEPLFALGGAYKQLGEFEHSLEAYKKIISLASPMERILAQRAMADAYFQTGRFREAIQELRAVMEGGGAVAETYYLLGKALDAQVRALLASNPGAAEVAKIEGDAVSALEAGLALDPSHAPSYYILGTIHRRQGKRDLAQRDLESFARFRPKTEVEPSEVEKGESLFEARTALQLARALLDVGDANPAFQLVQHALQVDPNFLDALAFQGWNYLKLNRREEAQRAYEAVLAKDPHHAEGLWNLGKLYLAAGQLEKGASLILESTEKQRSFAEGWELLTRLAQEHGIYSDRTEEFARSALRFKPSPQNYANLALFLFLEGNTPEAKKVLSEGLSRFPGDRDLSHILQQAGAPGK